MKYSWEFAPALEAYFGTLRFTRGISGTPLNLNFWRTNIELSRIRSTGCMSVSCPKWAIHETERIRRKRATESEFPFTVPGSVNIFAGNFKWSGFTYKKMNEQKKGLFSP